MTANKEKTSKKPATGKVTKNGNSETNNKSSSKLSREQKILTKRQLFYLQNPDFVNLLITITNFPFATKQELIETSCKEASNPISSRLLSKYLQLAGKWHWIYFLDYYIFSPLPSVLDSSHSNTIGFNSKYFSESINLSPVLNNSPLEALYTRPTTYISTNNNLLATDFPAFHTSPSLLHTSFLSNDFEEKLNENSGKENIIKKASSKIRNINCVRYFFISPTGAKLLAHLLNLEESEINSFISQFAFDEAEAVGYIRRLEQHALARKFLHRLDFALNYGAEVKQKIWWQDRPIMAWSKTNYSFGSPAFSNTTKLSTFTFEEIISGKRSQNGDGDSANDSTFKNLYQLLTQSNSTNQKSIYSKTSFDAIAFVANEGSHETNQRTAPDNKVNNLNYSNNSGANNCNNSSSTEPSKDYELNELLPFYLHSQKEGNRGTKTQLNPQLRKGLKPLLIVVDTEQQNCSWILAFLNKWLPQLQKTDVTIWPWPTLINSPQKEISQRLQHLVRTVNLATVINSTSLKERIKPGEVSAIDLNRSDPAKNTFLEKNRAVVSNSSETENSTKRCGSETLAKALEKSVNLSELDWVALPPLKSKISTFNKKVQSSQERIPASLIFLPPLSSNKIKAEQPDSIPTLVVLTTTKNRAAYWEQAIALTVHNSNNLLTKNIRSVLFTSEQLNNLPDESFLKQLGIAPESSIGAKTYINYPAVKLPPSDTVTEVSLAADKNLVQALKENVQVNLEGSIEKVKNPFLPNLPPTFLAAVSKVGEEKALLTYLLSRPRLRRLLHSLHIVGPLSIPNLSRLSLIEINYVRGYLKELEQLGVVASYLPIKVITLRSSKRKISGLSNERLEDPEIEREENILWSAPIITRYFKKIVEISSDSNDENNLIAKHRIKIYNEQQVPKKESYHNLRKIATKSRTVKNKFAPEQLTSRDGTSLIDDTHNRANDDYIYPFEPEKWRMERKAYYLTEAGLQALLWLEDFSFQLDPMFLYRKARYRNLSKLFDGSKNTKNQLLNNSYNTDTGFLWPSYLVEHQDGVRAFFLSIPSRHYYNPLTSYTYSYIAKDTKFSNNAALQLPLFASNPSSVSTQSPSLSLSLEAWQTEPYCFRTYFKPEDLWRANVVEVVKEQQVKQVEKLIRDEKKRQGEIDRDLLAYGKVKPDGFGVIAAFQSIMKLEKKQEISDSGATKNKGFSEQANVRLLPFYLEFERCSDSEINHYILKIATYIRWIWSSWLLTSIIKAEASPTPKPLYLLLVTPSVTKEDWLTQIASLATISITASLWHFAPFTCGISNNFRSNYPELGPGMLFNEADQNPPRTNSKKIEVYISFCLFNWLQYLNQTSVQNNSKSDNENIKEALKWLTIVKKSFYLYSGSSQRDSINWMQVEELLIKRLTSGRIDRDYLYLLNKFSSPTVANSPNLNLKIFSTNEKHLTETKGPTLGNIWREVWTPWSMLRSKENLTTDIYQKQRIQLSDLFSE